MIIILMVFSDSQHHLPPLHLHLFETGYIIVFARQTTEEQEIKATVDRNVF